MSEPQLLFIGFIREPSALVPSCHTMLDETGDTLFWTR